VVAQRALRAVIGRIANSLQQHNNRYKKKNWGVKLKEISIILMFLRPAVDAYRVSTNYMDDELSQNPLAEMMLNKAAELAMESIPGCVLQLYVWLTNPEDAGYFALVSFGISALTTGFPSAMIAFDMDVNVPRRKNQPTFYGYIPDDNGLRGRYFALMLMMSALHNLSRSLGVALLATSENKRLVVMFVGGELSLYILYKIARGECMYWTPDQGWQHVVGSFLARIIR